MTATHPRPRTFDPPKAAGYGAAARRGGRLGLISATVEQASSIGTTFVLVRILLPADFGAVAASNVILAFLAVVTQLGFNQALIKRESVDRRVASTMWWAAAFVGGMGSAAMLVFSQPLAMLFGIHVAGPYIAILGPVLVLKLTASIPRALLQRQLRFKQAYAADMLTALVYAAVQIGLAAAGAGAYAVVVGQLAAAIVLFVMLHTAIRWAPSPVFDRRILREEIGFSGGVFATTTMAWTNKNADYWVVGRIGDARRLGVYYIAYVLPNVLRQRLTWTTTEVLFPVLTRMRDDVDRLRAAYLRMLQLLAFAGFPAMMGISLLAPWVVRVAFGAYWRSSRGPMRVLAIAALVEFTTQAVTTLFLADGKPKLNARIEVLRFAVFVPGLALAAANGSIVAVAGAVLASSLAAAVYAQVLVCRRLQMSIWTPVRALLPVGIPTITMAVAVTILDAVTRPVAVIDASILVVVGAGAFFATGQAMFPRTFRQLLFEAERLVRGRG